MNWQTIETAPRDGTRFLAFEGFEPNIESASYDDDFGLFRPCSNRSEFWKQPTHWMPLPDAPIDSVKDPRVAPWKFNPWTGDKL
jgi:hypothetical protein